MAKYNDIAAFHKVLQSSNRILALCGAGLSAASGLPTFRGAGGLWRDYKATSIATPGAFEEDPGLVWLFYAYRRHMAFRAQPNAGHYALAALAKKKQDFLCLTQNVDGLSPRADHPASQLRLLHGSLMDIKCSNRRCTYVSANNTADPLCPALAPAAVDPPVNGEPLPLLDVSRPLETIDPAALPHCPDCGGLLRPAVVWFGEGLDEDMLVGINEWIDAAPVDLMLVVGTSAVVTPAADYIHFAREAGARVAVVNLEAETPDALRGMRDGDFAFAGDAAVLLPQLLEPVIGKLDERGESGQA